MAGACVQDAEQETPLCYVKKEPFRIEEGRKKPEKLEQ